MIIQNSNPNLYHCTGISENGRLALVPVVAFKIVEDGFTFAIYPLDINGAVCRIVFDKATDIVHREGKTPTYLESFIQETDPQRGSDLFAPGI